MFKYTIDNKKEYSNGDGVFLKDLGENIFSSRSNSMAAFTYYKNVKDAEMRPDKVSLYVYGTDDYAEMIMKYSLIDNPFAMEKDDILMVPSLNSVYADVITTSSMDTPANCSYSYVQNYHKYIDKNKVPDKAGSDEIEIDIPSTSDNAAKSAAALFRNDVEANMANRGKSGIRIENGRIYFGNNVSVNSSDITDVEGTDKANSDLVDCAKNGVTLGQFLNATIKNSI